MLRTELHLPPCAWTQATTSNRCLVRRDRSPPIRSGHSKPIATTAGERFSPIGFSLTGAVSSRGRTGDVVAPRR